ncbi:hypothetical protein [Saccharothrix syringae]|uniref:Uncharacterized protein n=1 Tax=Saccharothrix syringae TaxID=103733 RepID=A0A5Q0GWI3_SACSY|nr:hypothetical protein [Saccharothrix syringae]QFZ17874.1 hypothetical protein EKG83_10615 [Saccharothrix syringae]
MAIAEVCRALEGVPGVRVTALADRVWVHVPAIGDAVRVDVAAIRRHEPIRAPDGSPAVEFTLGDEHGTWPLIVTSTDVVYRPAGPRAVLVPAPEHRVGSAPHLVAYSEMERAAERLALDGERPGLAELSGLGAALLLVRCFIVGATLVGLRPVRGAGWWQRAWAAVGGDVPLPPFRADPVWDELVLAGPPEEGGAAVADFRRLEPGLTVVGLDDSFASSWRSRVPVAPAVFAGTLLRGLAGARARVALHPDGSGAVDVALGSGGAVRFGWSDVDELRVAEVGGAHHDLLRRLLLNTERLAALLGFGRVVFAAGVDAVAAAPGGYPRDPELFRLLRHSR